MCSTLKGTYKAEQRTATIKQPTALQWAAMGGNARQCKDMNRAHQLINGIAGNGKANQRGERLKHVQHPQRGTYKTEQRTATIKQPTELPGTEKQGTMNRYH